MALLRKVFKVNSVTHSGTRKRSWACLIVLMGSFSLMWGDLCSSPFSSGRVLDDCGSARTVESAAKVGRCILAKPEVLATITANRVFSSSLDDISPKLTGWAHYLKERYRLNRT